MGRTRLTRITLLRPLLHAMARFVRVQPRNTALPPRLVAPLATPDAPSPSPTSPSRRTPQSSRTTSARHVSLPRKPRSPPGSRPRKSKCFVVSRRRQEDEYNIYIFIYSKHALL